MIPPMFNFEQETVRARVEPSNQPSPPTSSSSFIFLYQLYHSPTHLQWLDRDFRISIIVKNKVIELMVCWLLLGRNFRTSEKGFLMKAFNNNYIRCRIIWLFVRGVLFGSYNFYSANKTRQTENACVASDSNSMFFHEVSLFNISLSRD